MTVAFRVGLLTVALALMAGAIWAALQSMAIHAAVYFLLAFLCGLFERLAAVRHE